MKKINIFSTVFGLMLALQASAQFGYFSGSLQTNANFFIRDPKVNAFNLPHYDNLKIGADAWFNLNYTNEKYELETGVRLDLFYNSILRVPTTPYTAVGLGNFYIKKKVKDLTISAGYLYDQIGTGIIYRSFEERTLGIDNALVGARLEYNVKDFLKLKTFAGVQKLKFSFQKPIIFGFNAEGNFAVKDKVRFAPGFGIINRSMDKASINQIVSTIETYDTLGRFVPKYNTYAFTLYNTLSAGDFTWYIEGAYKTPEAIKNNELRQVVDSLINSGGSCVYTSLNYSHPGVGITLQFKRTENFYLHTSPNPTEATFDGTMNFIPPVSRQNSLRLPSRYFAPSLENHELSFSADITASPVKALTLTFSGSYVRDFIFKKYNPVNTPFFGEGFASALYKINKKTELELGFQFVRYNKFVYQQDGAPDVNAYTLFAEWVYKFNRKLSLRLEVQYQNVKKDYGQWIYGLAEFNIAPHFSVAVSDMWNFQPNPDINPNANHYYNVFFGYTQGPMTFTLAYVKQVEGIVCTGGVCRLEPAFSGVKFGANVTF